MLHFEVYHTKLRNHSYVPIDCGFSQRLSTPEAAKQSLILAAEKEQMEVPKKTSYLWCPCTVTMVKI